MSDTPLLQLPLLEAAQAQKHVTHNEALLRLDGLIHLAVISRAATAPPQAAADGARYLVPQSPAGAWAGQAGMLALAQGGGWVFLSPRSGWRLWVEDERRLLLFDGAAWINLLAAEGFDNLRRVGINATADEVNRLTVSSPAVLFTHAGSGQQVKLNKNAEGDTASLLYQTGWSGRAEMGLAGDDDFRIKVSADGAAWREAIVIDRASGAVTLPHTPPPAAAQRVLHSQSLVNQAGFANESYLNGSGIAIPAGALQAGTRYRAVFDVSKTAAGVAAPALRLRFGTAAALTAPAIATLAFPAQTAVADEGRFSLEATFRRVGSGTGAQVLAVAALTHTQAAAGLSTSNGPVRRAVSAGFDSDVPDAVIGISVQAGAAAAWTVTLVQASLENLA